MRNQNTKSLNQVIFSLIGQRLLVFWVLAFFIIFTSLAIFLFAQEKSKYELLTGQITSQINPLLQIGDEIQVRGELERIVQRSNYNGVIVTNNNDIKIEVIKDPQNKNISSNIKDSDIIDLATSEQLLFKKSFSIFENTKRNFTIIVSYKNINRAAIFENAIYTSIFLLVILTLILLTIFSSIKDQIINPFTELKTFIKNFSEDSKGNSFHRENAEKLRESSEILQEFENLQSVLSEKNLEIIRKSIEEKRGEFASSTIHDLKSYISIIQTIISSEGKNISEENYEALKKTVSSVHSMTQKILNFDDTREIKTSSFLLDSLVQEVIDLKSIEYSENKISIESLNAFNEGIFVKANRAELKNIISNLINNSVEAIGLNKTGSIQVRIFEQGGFARLIVKDNGTGIPQEIIENVFHKDFSTKESTESIKRGKGLFSAKKFMESIGGDIFAESSKNGAELKISIPLSSKEDWFPKSINIHGLDTLIVADDDLVALKKLETYIQDNEQLNKLEIKSFSSLIDLRACIKENDIDFQKSLFFIDNDFSGQLETGYDFICNNKLEDKAVLITNRFEDDLFIQKCEKNNIKLIPKNIVEKTAVLNFKNSDLFPNEVYDFIVIDDDEVTRMMYSKLFELNNFRACIYDDVEPFYKACELFSQKTPIIIDSKLKNGLKGEFEALKIRNELGFKHIFLATNYSEKEIDEISAINAILKKEEILKCRS